jgi:hypothetical protein
MDAALKSPTMEKRHSLSLSLSEIQKWEHMLLSLGRMISG